MAKRREMVKGTTTEEVILSTAAKSMMLMNTRSRKFIRPELNR